jgi:hypothetical protein
MNLEQRAPFAETERPPRRPRAPSSLSAFPDSSKAIFSRAVATSRQSTLGPFHQPNLAEKRLHHGSFSSTDTAGANPVFSVHCALFQNSAHLIENKGQARFCKLPIFNQFRTLLHSSPASPVLSICSPKHTGGVPSHLLTPIISTRQSVVPKPCSSATSARHVHAVAASDSRGTPTTSNSPGGGSAQPSL